MVAIPIGYVGLITPRSGLSTKYGLVLSNTVGVIDADYRGEVQLMIQRKPIDEPAFVIEPMARLAQLIIVPCYTVIEVVDSLDETDRGINGFGSTGHL
jgi:dUTP pyrophosphatase